MVDRVGQQLGNYRITRKLGHGGFADVYLGEHVFLKTLVAIKVLQARLTYEEDLNNFLKEAQTVARLIHPNIVRVTDFGISEETPYLVMDYAEGGTLRQRHSPGSRLALTTIVPYVVQLADALQYAHNERLIHRDIKPENMLIGTHGNILLSDFGIALVSQSSRYQGTQQDITGTVAYMAPEQLQGKPSRASDQYALGVTVYEWICGERPFHGSFIELYAQHVNVPPPSLRAKVPSLAPDVEQVVMTALAKDAKQRFGNISAFANALAQASGQTHLIKSRPIPLPPPPASSTPLPPMPLSPPVAVSSSPVTPPVVQAPPPTSAENIFGDAFREINTGNPEVQTPSALPQQSDLSVELIADIQARIEAKEKVQGSNSQPSSTPSTPQDQADILADINARLATEEKARQAQAAKPTPPAQPAPRSSGSQNDILADVQAQIAAQQQAKQVPPPPPPPPANQQTPLAARPAPQVQPIYLQAAQPAPVAQPTPVRQQTPAAQPTPVRQQTPVAQPPPVRQQAPVVPPAPVKQPTPTPPRPPAQTPKPFNAWQFGWKQIISIVVGVVLYVVLTRINGLSFSLAIIVPLFFGSLFGPWSGMLTIILGVIAVRIFNSYYYSLAWQFYVGDGLIGLIPGLVYAGTRGRYPTYGKAFLASFIGIIGTALGFSFNLFSTTTSSVATQILGRVLLPDAIYCIIALPILLLIYDKITHPNKS